MRCPFCGSDVKLTEIIRSGVGRILGCRHCYGLAEKIGAGAAAHAYRRIVPNVPRTARTVRAATPGFVL